MAPNHDALLAAVRGIPGVSHPAVVSRTGEILAGSFDSDGHHDTIAAMAAIIHASGETLGKELKRGFGHAVLSGDKGSIVVMPAVGDVLLITPIEGGTAVNETVTALLKAANNGGNE